MSASQVHYKSNKDLIATYGPLVIWIDAGVTEGRSESLHRIAQLFAGALANEPSVSLLMIMQEGSRLPDGDTRESAAKLFNELGDRFKGLNVVLLGGGFWASALRSAITGIGLMLRQRASVRVFTALDSAAEHVAEQLGKFEAGALQSTCEDLRSQLQQG